MNSFPPGNPKELELAERMSALGVQESDIKETFVRSGGHGGQNVNKTSTCVMLRHRPSGIQVKCQQTRHQAMNRLLARRLLLEKIEAERRNRHAAARAQAEKVRRQKRKRSHAAQQQILKEKFHHAAKKQARRKPDFD